MDITVAITSGVSQLKTAAERMPLGYRVVLVLPFLAALCVFPQRGHAGSLANSKGLVASGTKTVRIAIVQMRSLNHDIDGNLKRATEFALTARDRGAQLVLFPEFMPTGAYLSFDTWDSAEPSNGKTVQWLKATAGRLHVWLGTSFLEAEGEDFYDTFVLTTPDGQEAGRVRKAVPAAAEANFFRGEQGPHILNTAIGKIGIGICAENYYCAFPGSDQTVSGSCPHAACGT